MILVFLASMNVILQRIYKGIGFLMNIIRYAVVFTIICNGLEVYGQTFRLSIEQFAISDGLSNNHVTALFQDSRGYIWVGTTDGLNRYDGYEFAVFRHHPLDTTSIVGNYILTITETPDGNIWIGTRNSGIAIWQKKNGNFHNLDKNSAFFKSLRETGVYGMEVADGSVWVKTRNSIGRINQDLLSYEKFEHYQSVLKKGLSNKYPVVASHDHIWFGSKDGIQFFDTQHKVSGTIKRKAIVNQGEVSSLVNIGDSLLFSGSQNGLWKSNLKEDVFKPLYKQNNNGVHEGISALLLHNDELWIGTSKGLMTSKAPYESYQPFDIGINSSEPFFNISSILVDNSNLLWIGTKQDGLFKIDRKRPKFSSIASGECIEYPIDCYDFQSVYVDEENYLWLGTNTKGIYRINRATKKFHQFLIYPPYSQTEEPVVNAIYKDSEGKLWFGTNDGVYFFNKKSGRICEFDYANSTDFRYLLKSNVVNDIVEDRNGNIWFATQFGLYRYDGYKITSYWADVESDQSLCDDEINVLFEDKSGLIWIGTNNGINTYNCITEEFERIQNVEGEEKRLSHNIITAFAEDHERIIIGTHSGLSYCEKSNRSNTGFWKYDDLISGKIYAIEVDDYNRIWLSTGVGICSILPGGSPFYYNKNDGVPDYNFNVGSSFNYNSQQLFFGGDKGLTIIDTEFVPTNINKPKVVICSVSVYYKGKKKNHFEGELKEISIRYQRNTMIQVDYAALEYTYPVANTYRIFLDGHDDDWRAVSRENKVNFSNLSPGTYTLKVIGANNDGVLNNEPTELIIHVEPPLWMSSYAYAFYIIFGILLIQTLINYRIRNYRKAYRALNEKAVDKKKIEVQKESLTRIHQSLTDSISYAKRIQEAMIPSEEMVRKNLPDSFIYFRPKDIVSGDFYWTYCTDGKMFFAAVDCTGHGVPGAFMSIIGYDLLKNIVEIQGEHCTANILNRLSKEVALTFQKNGKDGDLNKQSIADGMDISLIMLDKTNNTLQFSGAMSPLYLVRDNEIMTFKGDRFPIGYSDDTKTLSYSKQEIDVYPEDVLYLFSDGFADQFGGSEGKKFKYRRFRHLLLNIHKLPIEDQKAILHQKLEEWMGTEYEQVDDILIMGYRL